MLTIAEKEYARWHLSSATSLIIHVTLNDGTAVSHDLVNKQLAWIQFNKAWKNVRHFSDSILKSISLHKDGWIGMTISLKVVPKSPEAINMMTSSNGNIFRVTGHLCGELCGSPVKSPHKGQWRGALMFSLICARINGWVDNGDAGDFRRYLAHYDVTVMNQH